MLLQSFRILLLVVVAAIAAVTDIKKKLIYDWITLPAIIIGILISIYECFSICNIFNFLIPLAVFLLSYPLYYAGKLGGGDVKLFTAIAALMPIRNKTIFIIDVLIFASILALAFFGIYYTAKLYWRGKLKLNYRNVIKGFGLALLLFFYILVLYLLNANSI
ncbi:MAG: prepilin peptidase, partial [Candidatus Diapherotrites archaeon]|nr:prepilin peptidase [Candidatus Diapherotrites archaeon]